MQSDIGRSHTNCTIFVQSLSLFTIPILIKYFLRFGKIRVFYVNSNNTGLRIVNWLYAVRVLTTSPVKILRTDLWPIDNSKNQAHVIKTQAYTELVELKDDICEIVTKVLPHIDDYYRQLLISNIIKRCNDDLRNYEQNRLVNYAKLHMEKSTGDSIVILRTPLIRDTRGVVKRHKLWGDCTIVYQFTFSKTIIAHLSYVFSRLVFCVLPGRKRSNQCVNEDKSLGVAACWGIDELKQNDFFWWHHTNLVGSRLRYLFDRHDYQPNHAVVSSLRDSNIVPFALNRTALGDFPEIYFRGRVSYREILQSVCIIFRALRFCLLADFVIRDILLVLILEISSHVKLQKQYELLNLGVLWHYQESGADQITSAIHMAGGVRFGTHWSCGDSPNTSNMRTPHVFFVWGTHDARICLASDSISQHLIIAGCAISEMNENIETLKLVQKESNAVRDNGAEIVLTLFDNSTLAPNFYQFFLEWMLEEKKVGILVKPKKDNMVEAHSDLANLFARASSTGRISILHDSIWPADVARVSDFCIGMGTMSAIAVSAIAGSRVIYLDYAQLDHNQLTKPFSTLHSLGKNKCVFYDHESLQQSIMQYVSDPLTMVSLGDASSVIDQFDPFRDGKSRERIGEYIENYVNSIDKGYSREDSLNYAVQIYAEKWGEDKIVRGIV
tara:strand:- start:3772 stop:5775 length:2004 start_codon:yes stop_codon:yes gene_type:complete